MRETAQPSGYVSRAQYMTTLRSYSSPPSRSISAEPCREPHITMAGTDLNEMLDFCTQLSPIRISLTVEVVDLNTRQPLRTHSHQRESQPCTLAPSRNNVQSRGCRRCRFDTPSRGRAPVYASCHRHGVSRGTSCAGDG